METNKEESWEEVSPNVWKPINEGDCIEGVLIQKRSKVGSFASEAYMLENVNGQFLVWGCTVLDERMNFINEGDRIKIEFKGVEKNKKGQDVKVFKVLREKK